MEVVESISNGYFWLFRKIDFLNSEIESLIIISKLIEHKSDWHIKTCKLNKFIINHDNNWKRTIYWKCVYLPENKVNKVKIENICELFFWNNKYSVLS